MRTPVSCSRPWPILADTLPTDLPALVASFFTLSGAGFGQPPRNSFIERCEAAAEAGFAGIGFHADDLARTVDGGLEIAELAAILKVNGLEVVEIEFLGGWALDVDETVLGDTVTNIEAVADACGGRHVSAGEFRSGDVDVDVAANRLGSLAGRLAARRLSLAIEPFPWSAISTVDCAVELIRGARQAGAPNVGLMVDVWHFYNCGADPSLLDTLPPDGIAAVQLNDGVPVHSDFLTEARAHRQLPGEGDLDVVSLVRAVRRAGYSGPYCVEANTEILRSLPVQEAASRAFDAASAVLVDALRLPTPRWA
jgi:sugar phosphate isomerase/epimerase